MSWLPTMLEEDKRQIDAALQDLITQSESEFVLLAGDGFIISQFGKPVSAKVDELAALASNCFLAHQSLGLLVGEEGLTSIYQEGKTISFYAESVDEHNILLVFFRPPTNVGAVKYYAGPAKKLIAAQFKTASERAPGEGMDPIVLNLSDSTQLFKQKQE